jgi:hypothetical protein
MQSSQDKFRARLDVNFPVVFEYLVRELPNCILEIIKQIYLDVEHLSPPQRNSHNGKERYMISSTVKLIRDLLTSVPAKSRTIAVRLISMAMTGYYKTVSRPRTHRPLSMMKYDPVGMSVYGFMMTCTLRNTKRAIS